MGVLDKITPQQRQIAMIGVPAVAAFALISKFRQPAADASNSEDAPATTSGWTMPSTDAIGTGQLAEFESLVTAGLNNLAVKTEETSIYTGTVSEQLTGQIGTLTEQVSTLANAPPPAQQETYPQPPPVVPPPAAPCPTPPPGWPGNPGEVIIGKLDRPGGGCWYFSNYGGVANMGAPFKGSAISHGFGPGKGLDPPRLAVSFNALGSGYQIWSNRGEHYDF